MLPDSDWVSTLDLDLRLLEVLDSDQGKVINSDRAAGVDLDIVQVIDPVQNMIWVIDSERGAAKKSEGARERQ